MSADLEDLPRPDQLEGAPHPAETPRLYGQGAAEAAFLDAFNAGRLHHAWLITGPQGTGKATLAYRIARFLLTTPPPGGDGGLFGAPPPPETLDVDPAHPVCARILARSEPGLRVITRSPNDKGKMRDQIVVDDIRKLSGFFQMSASDGGHRVVLIDAADDMNVSAANALLKMLEEPPARCTLLLLCHQPARLLPTIRSRCRTLRCAPLGAEDARAALQAAGADAPSPALAELAGGSVGHALALGMAGGQEIYAHYVALLGSMPRFDRTRALAMAEAAGARGHETGQKLMIDLLDLALGRLARQGASGQPAPEAAPQEAEIFARLAPTPAAARLWAAAAAELLPRLRQGRAVNLDPAVLLLDTLTRLAETASQATKS